MRGPKGTREGCARRGTMPIAPAWREVGSQEGGPVNRMHIIRLLGESPLGSQVKTSQCCWTPHGSPRGRGYISAGAEIPRRRRAAARLVAADATRRRRWEESFAALASTTFASR